MSENKNIGDQRLVLQLVTDLIGLAGEHNPQHPEMEKLIECPEYHEHECGHCEIIHRARRFLNQNQP